MLHLQCELPHHLKTNVSILSEKDKNVSGTKLELWIQIH
jgi:hypothetical protein